MSYPFHINPETNRANKCYRVDRCRFGLSPEDHYATAEEALAVRDERIAETELAKASEAYYQSHDKRINALLNQSSEQRTAMVRHLKKVVNKLGLDVNENTKAREVIKLAGAAENSDSVASDLQAAKAALKEMTSLRKKVKNLDSDYSGWNRYYEAPGGRIHSSINHPPRSSAWDSQEDREWLVDLSGKSEEEVVERQGTVMCSDCFADLSSEWTVQGGEAKEERTRVQCEGSGTTDYDKGTASLGKDRGNNAVCDDCGQRVTVNLTGKLRRHSRAMVEADSEMSKEQEVVQEATTEVPVPAA